MSVASVRPPSLRLTSPLYKAVISSSLSRCVVVRPCVVVVVVPWFRFKCVVVLVVLLGFESVIAHRLRFVAVAAAAATVVAFIDQEGLLPSRGGGGQPCAGLLQTPPVRLVRRGECRGGCL